MKYKSNTARGVLASIAATGLFATACQAVITMTITDDGTHLTMRATGTYDLSGAPNVNDSASLGANAAVAPFLDSFPNPNGAFGWETGTGGATYAVSASGSLSGDSGAFPADILSTTNPFYYVNNQLIFSSASSDVGSVDETAVFLNTTLADLGMVTGETVNITWAGDSAVITTTPVPEPQSALIMGLGIAGWVAWRKRKSAKA